MKKLLGLSFIVFLICPGFSWEAKLKESKIIRKNLTFTSTSKTQKLEVDNIFGSIQLKGYGGKEVQAVIKKTISAKDKDNIDLAKDEVELEISQKNNIISFYVDGPFRCRRNSSCRKYRVQYDFEIQVPQNTEVCLRTVNNGDIRVQNLTKDFSVRNVNGKIYMDGIRGSGDARTVNGKVEVNFTANPRNNCHFRTINGNLELFFPSIPSADFYFKTFNGEIYSDYQVEYLPATAGKGKRKNGKYIYKSNRFQGVRIGKGGPTIKMDTLNGNILISQKK